MLKSTFWNEEKEKIVSCLPGEEMVKLYNQGMESVEKFNIILDDIGERITERTFHSDILHEIENLKDKTDFPSICVKKALTFYLKREV